MSIDFKNTSASVSVENVKSLTCGLNLKAHVITFGCQQNEADSEKIKGMALDMGYSLSDSPEDADLIIVNTCTIRKHAEMKALSLIGRFKALKKKKPSLIIGVCGCMAAEPSAADMLKHDFHYVSFTLEPSQLQKLPELVERYYRENKRSFMLPSGNADIVEGINAVRSSAHKGWVSIMYGCNNFCSYCIVPYVRGRERSRGSADIISECKALIDGGCREITLLGQNVNSYKSDMDFPQLLSKIAEIDGDFIIRFMTSHPKDVSDKLIEAMGKYSPKIAPYFHLPLQSGSNDVLKRMNRPYTAEKFLEIVEKLRKSVPDIALSSDVIVGFPGESEEDFQNTLSVLSKVQFDMVYSFIYSVRKGTVAEKMDNHLSDEVKSERMNRLLSLSTEISEKKNAEYLGREVRVLVDSCENARDRRIYSARTLSNKLVHFESENAKIGEFIKVKIVRTAPFDLFAEEI